MSGSVDVKQHYSKKKSSQKQRSHYESISHHSSRSCVSQHSYAAHKSSHAITTTGVQQSFVQLEKGSEFIPSKLLPPRVKKYLAMDPDTNELIGYVVPVFRTSHEFSRGLVEVQEEVKEEGVGQVAMRNLFSRATSSMETSSMETSSMEMVTVEKKSRKKNIRESAERMQLSKKIEERVELRKKQNSDNLTHPPEFIVRPRGQTVWEGKTVKLHCTVAGWPKPRVAWYKNNVLIDAKTHPDKYTVESNYNMHSLEIKNCDFLDTAQYRASSLNIKGERSCIATVVIKSSLEKHPNSVFSPSDGFCEEHGVTFHADIIESFEVAFGREGETLSLGCTVIVYPTIKRYQPDVVWYRDGVALSESKWVHSHWSGDKATLTLVHLNKEDEGLYTLRVNTKSGFQTHSAYVFVRDEEVELEGVPVAPLDVLCHDANKDYVVVTWKQPAVEGESPILGYLIDRCEVGQHHWAQCNETPVKYARFPVTGLIEGKTYTFRVRAINRAGVSRPSRASDPVTAIDPHDRARHRAGPSAPFTGMIKFTEEDATVGVVPGEPTDLVVTEATKSYVVLAWTPPTQRGHEGVMYIVEKCIAGTDCWQRANTGIPVKSPRFALFDLAEGNTYSFRVRCFNSAGVSESSAPTAPITVGDMLDLPAAPGPAVATRNTDTSVVVSWGASKDVKHLVGYYIDHSVVGSNVWTPCNNKPVKETRYFTGRTVNTSHYISQSIIELSFINSFSNISKSVIEVICQSVGQSIINPVPPVHLVEAARDYMVVGWKEPIVTGGADIRGYFVDYRTVKAGFIGQWRELNHKALTTTSYKAENLKENYFYQFQVRAVNMVGISEASLPSMALECKEYTLAKPGVPRCLHVLEVRNTSVVLLWEPPTFDGRSPVNGYYVDLKEAAPGEDWKGANNKATKLKYMKVNGLIAGRSYVFRVRAQNLAGVGEPSTVLGPVLALTMPGTHEIVLDVDDDGVISMIFECSKMAEGSKFVWSKNYKAMTDTSRLTIVTEGSRYVLSLCVFLGFHDLGIFSCEVTNTDGVSASYNLTEAGLKHLLDISHDHKFPIIPFKTEMAMDLLEKGRVRFWTQVEKFTSDCKVEYVFNDVIVENGKKYTMNFDKNTGIIEMFMDSLMVTDEGTFTFNLIDGKAKGSTSLVLIGEVTQSVFLPGPHFVDYLDFEVTPECNVLLKATVRFYNRTLCRKDAGMYEVKLKDDRGKDISLFNLTDAGTETLLSWFYCIQLIYYGSTAPLLWFHCVLELLSSSNDSSDRVNEPTEKDKGKYTINISDGKDGVKRVCDLSGQGRIYRARVVGGLPDVVTIQEGKSLNLTGNVWGDPTPEVSWLKNDKELVSDERYALKFENGKFASITIASVTPTDSGKYALLVKNKYGTEAGEFTVSGRTATAMSSKSLKATTKRKDNFRDTDPFYDNNLNR
uniref:Myomesin 1a (skelemin) n=1 Tax=Esox lucius TaxID=8010 RepID=A0A3P8ZSK3_ESOLU